MRNISNRLPKGGVPKNYRQRMPLAANRNKPQGIAPEAENDSLERQVNDQMGVTSDPGQAFQMTPNDQRDQRRSKAKAYLKRK
jgi:hypothetical protein